MSAVSQLLDDFKPSDDSANFDNSWKDSLPVSPHCTQKKKNGISPEAFFQSKICLDKHHFD